jgi:SAM-dependent methyltransferase
LDLGSGTGHDAAALERLSGRRVIEADVSNLWCVGPGPVLFDGRRLPFADRAFSACVLIFVLQYVSDPAALWSEIRRVVAGPALVLQSVASVRPALFGVRTSDEILGPFGARAAGLAGYLPPAAAVHGWAVERSFDRQSFPRWLESFGLCCELIEAGPCPIPVLRHDLFRVSLQ